MVYESATLDKAGRCKLNESICERGREAERLALLLWKDHRFAGSIPVLVPV